ncbi:hypothetical protein CR513_22046, partial [Mucuna pruriens]
MKGVINPPEVVEEEEVEAILVEQMKIENDDKSLWYLDNGASNHMCGYKEKFVELEEKVRKNVSFDGSHKFIKDVYYVPKLKSNILSLEQLVEKGNVKGQTPQEAWSGVKPKVDHLRVFGCIAYAHVPNQGRSKIDDKSVKHVFIGYDANSKGYKLYNPNNGKMIISKDVEFNEEEAWNWEKEEDTCDFLSYFKEGDQEVVAPKTPPPLQTLSIDEASSSEGSSSERIQKIRSIQEIYDETKIINDLFCLFVDSEPLTFDEIMEDKRWRQAMEEEIKVIKKNDTWELSNLPKCYEAIGVMWVFKDQEECQRRGGKIQSKACC